MSYDDYLKNEINKTNIFEGFLEQIEDFSKYMTADMIKNNKYIYRRKIELASYDDDMAFDFINTAIFSKVSKSECANLAKRK